MGRATPCAIRANGGAALVQPKPADKNRSPPTRRLALTSDLLRKPKGATSYARSTIPHEEGASVPQGNIHVL